MLGPNLRGRARGWVSSSWSRYADEEGKRHTHSIVAHERYLVLSLYAIPAMQMTTSTGSLSHVVPSEKVRRCAGSRRFFAYSSAAHEAPSLSGGSSCTVSLRGEVSVSAYVGKKGRWSEVGRTSHLRGRRRWPRRT